jgi:hypothetical protein
VNQQLQRDSDAIGGSRRFDLVITDAWEWIHRDTKKPVSEFGKVVATILCRGFRTGIYNVSGVSKADWSREDYVEIRIRHRDLSTFDFGHLTNLVIVCHDACVRLSINPVNMTHLALVFHPRKGRTGRMSERHPTIEDAIAELRGKAAAGRNTES